MNVAGTLATSIFICCWTLLLAFQSSGQSAREDQLAIRDMVDVKSVSIETSNALITLAGSIQLGDRESEDQVRSAMLKAAMLLSMFETMDSSESPDESARELYRTTVRVLAGARQAASEAALRSAATSPRAPTYNASRQMESQIDAIEANLGRLDRYFSSGDAELANPIR